MVDEIVTEMPTVETLHSLISSSLNWSKVLFNLWLLQHPEASKFVPSLMISFGDLLPQFLLSLLCTPVELGVWDSALNKVIYVCLPKEIDDIKLQGVSHHNASTSPIISALSCASLLNGASLLCAVWSIGPGWPLWPCRIKWTDWGPQTTMSFSPTAGQKVTHEIEVNPR